MLSCLLTPLFSTARAETELNSSDILNQSLEVICLSDTSSKSVSDSLPSGSFRHSDPRFLQTRYGFLSSAVPLGKWQGYAQISLLGLSRISLGITKNLSFGISAKILPVFFKDRPEMPHIYFSYGGRIHDKWFLSNEFIVGTLEDLNFSEFRPTFFANRITVTFTSGRYNFSSGIVYGAERLRYYPSVVSSEPGPFYYFKQIYLPATQIGGRVIFTKYLSLFGESLIVPKYRREFVDWQTQERIGGHYFKIDAQLGVQLDFKQINIALTRLFQYREEPFMNIDLTVKF